MHVSRGTSGNDLHNVFIEAGAQAGHAFTEDVNGYRQEGMGMTFDIVEFSALQLKNFVKSFVLIYVSSTVNVRFKKVFGNSKKLP